MQAVGVRLARPVGDRRIGRIRTIAPFCKTARQARRCFARNRKTGNELERTEFASENFYSSVLRVAGGIELATSAMPDKARVTRILAAKEDNMHPIANILLLLLIFAGALAVVVFLIGLGNGWPLLMAIGIALIPLVLTFLFGMLGVFLSVLFAGAMYKAYG